MDFKTFRTSVLGKSQTEMAELLGCTQSFISAIDRGVKGLSTKMVDALLAKDYYLRDLDAEAYDGCSISPRPDMIKFGERLKRFREDNALTVEMMCDLLDTSPIYYAQLEQGIRELNHNKRRDFLANPDYDMSAFMPGRKYQQSVEVASPKVVTPYGAMPVEYVPLLNLDAKAGFGANSAVDVQEYTQQLVPFANAHQGDFAVMVDGDSMSPAFVPGTIILLRSVELWRDFLPTGQLYVIELTDYRRFFKQLLPGSRPDTYTLHSFNPSYPDSEVPRAIINRVFEVKASYKSHQL